jgi:hypothetical protein
MYKIILSLSIAITLLATACSKPIDIQPVTPAPGYNQQIRYTNLNNREVLFARNATVLDVNQDGQYDLIFGTQLVGDPIYQVDKRQFLASAHIDTYIPVNFAEQFPALSFGQQIPLLDFNGYTWYNASSSILMERWEDVRGNITWRGNWLAATSKYLPIQIHKNSRRYNGWVELTVDHTAQKIVLHRMAVHTIPETAIRAGY